MTRFSIERQKTKTKAVAKANQKKGKYLYEPMRAQAKASELPKVRENAGDQVVIGFNFAFIWLRESGAGVVDQSQSETNAIGITSQHSIEN